MHAGMRCVPINPLVLAPQIKKLAESNQKSRELAMECNTATADSATGATAGKALACLRAIRRKTDIARPFADKQREGNNSRRAAGNHHRRRTPAVAFDQGRENG